MLLNNFAISYSMYTAYNNNARRCNLTLVGLHQALTIRRYSVGILHFFFRTQRKKLPNLGSIFPSRLIQESNPNLGKGLVAPSLFRQVPDSLMIRRYEPGRKNHELDPRLGNFLLCV